MKTYHTRKEEELRARQFLFDASHEVPWNIDHQIEGRLMLSSKSWVNETICVILITPERTQGDLMDR